MRASNGAAQLGYETGLGAQTAISQPPSGLPKKKT
jgi:hypothetical protein